MSLYTRNLMWRVNDTQVDWHLCTTHTQHNLCVFGRRYRRLSEALIAFVICAVVSASTPLARQARVTAVAICAVVAVTVEATLAFAVCRLSACFGLRVALKCEKVVNSDFLYPCSTAHLTKPMFWLIVFIVKCVLSFALAIAYALTLSYPLAV